MSRFGAATLQYRLQPTLSNRSGDILSVRIRGTDTLESGLS